jgi:hypothetical protein
MLSYGLSHWEIGSQVAVLGLVDLDAMPKTKLTSLWEKTTI